MDLFLACPTQKLSLKKRLTFTSVNQAVLKWFKNLETLPGKKLSEPILKIAPPELVYINPEACIGCTLCIQKCPVDAIAGAEGFLHTVIVDECNGCGICVSSCPVDCITEKKRTKDNPWTNTKASISKTRFYEKRARKKNYDSKLMKNGLIL